MPTPSKIANETPKGKLNIAVMYTIVSSTLPEAAKTDEKVVAQSTAGKRGVGVIRTGLYCRWRSDEVAGFSLKEIGSSALSPKFRVSPLERRNGLLSPMESVIFGQTLNLVENDDFGEKQIVGYHQGEAQIELFRATFLPFSKASMRRMRVCILDEDRVHVPVGCIEWSTLLGIGTNALIMDCVNNQGFKTKTTASGGIEVVRKGENESVAAIISIRGCVNHQLTFGTDTTENASWETKVLLLCTLIMTVIIKNETNAADKLGEDMSELCAAFLLLFILIGLWVGVYFF